MIDWISTGLILVYGASTKCHQIAPSSYRMQGRGILAVLTAPSGCPSPRASYLDQDPPRQGIVTRIGQQCFAELPVVALLPTWTAPQTCFHRKRTFHFSVEFARKRCGVFLLFFCPHVCLALSPLGQHEITSGYLVLRLVRFDCPQLQQCSHLMLLK